MEHPRISLIAALGAKTRAIGKDGSLLWRISDDLKRFKSLTMGHPIIMGRKTYESIGKPLPGRTNIVISNTILDVPAKVHICASIEDALSAARATGTDEIFIIGGGQVYAQTIANADRLYLTLVDDNTPGDTSFPNYTLLPFAEISREVYTHEGVRFTFATYERHP